MHRHDGRGPGGDGRLDAVGVDAAVRRIDVHEHGLDAVPPDRVSSGNEAERGGYHLAGDAKGLEGRYQGQCAVGEEADVGHLKVLAQGGLQFLMVVSVVGYPLARPDVPQVCVEFVQVRKERGRDGYLSVVHLFIFYFLFRLRNPSAVSLISAYSGSRKASHRPMATTAPAHSCTSSIHIGRRSSRLSGQTHAAITAATPKDGRMSFIWAFIG